MLSWVSTCCGITLLHVDRTYSVLRRFLVHRYSVLQHNAEVNGIEGVDEPLDTNVAAPAKIEFHDDSDEVGLLIRSHHLINPHSLYSGNKMTINCAVNNIK